MKQSLINNWSALNIVLAENDPGGSRYLEVLMKRNGANVIIVDGGTDALIECLVQKKIDLALIETQLPYINGLEVIRHVSQLKPEIKIIALTTFLSNHLSKWFKYYNVSDYLLKPIEKNHFYATINRIIFPGADKNILTPLQFN